jgi:hypothetical protein
VPVEAATFAQIWPALSPHLNADLVPSDHHDWLHNVFAATPRGVAHFLGFETRLGNKTGPTDCALSLTPSGARLLAGYDGDRPPALSGPAWDRLGSFLRLWAGDPQSSFADATRIWLEFDMQAGALAPNVLFGYWPRTHEPWRTRHWLLKEAIPTLLGQPLPTAVTDNVERALDACRVCNDFQIGVMSARPVPVVRICVFDLPDDELPAYLSTIGWRGEAAGLAAFVRAFRPHADFVGLHFDAGEKIYPHAGIEPGFDLSNWGRQPHLEPRWAGQFEVLERAGLITEGKRRAMLAWPGSKILSQDRAEIALLRGLSHIKVVLRADGASEAKGYFGIAERPLVNEQRATA